MQPVNGTKKHKTISNQNQLNTEEPYWTSEVTPNNSKSFSTSTSIAVEMPAVKDDGFVVAYGSRNRCNKCGFISIDFAYLSVSNDNKCSLIRLSIFNLKQCMGQDAQTYYNINYNYRPDVRFCCANIGIDTRISE